MMVLNSNGTASLDTSELLQLVEILDLMFCEYTSIEEDKHGGMPSDQLTKERAKWNRLQDFLDDMRYKLEGADDSMSKTWDITSKVIKGGIGRPMTADLVVLVSCPVCKQSEHIDLELTDDVFTWECANCKSKIESTIVAKKVDDKGANDVKI